jgi:hypothetical protein
MLRKLALVANLDAARFTTAYKAFCFGRIVWLQADLKAEPQKREDRRIDLQIIRAFEAVSVPDPAATRLHGDVPARKLVADGVLTLKQPELERLQKYMNRGPCDTGHLALLEETLDWLDSADKEHE